MIPSYVPYTSRPFRMVALIIDQKYQLKGWFYQIEDELVLVRPRSRTSLSSRGRACPRSRTSSSSRGQACPRSRTSRPLQNRSTQKQQIMNYCFVKLNYHAEPNHPAKYGGPGVRSLKVSFFRINEMSSPFKDFRGPKILIGFY